MRDIPARDIQPHPDPHPVLVAIEGIDVLAKRLARTSGQTEAAIDLSEVWRRIGTAEHVVVIRDGLSVRTWRAVGDGAESAVVGPSRKAVVRGMLALLGLREVTANATSAPLF